ncbi:SDR family oxidoreductase [Deinococcus planocerae]|uniref:SDR family oxidoreductase n=1 Tax=Deinococcus planocerae TaxID=1737569 RepID=UPI000C7F6192|nr:NmrA family NAD(P)-binding protein [Deinococcus planocerae]
MNTILVYGATGSQGEPVARRLLEAGHRVRILVRQPERAGDLRALGAEVMQGDLSDAEATRRASTGADGVVFHLPFAGGNPMDRPMQARNVIDAAREAGVRLLVWNASGEIAPERTGNPGLDVRLDVLEVIQASGVPYVVLQPTGYMENFLGPWTAPEVASRDVFTYPVPNEVRMQWIASDDLGKFVAYAFAHPELAPLNLKVAGPERLSAEEVAERFSRALGRPIRFEPQSPEVFGERMDTIYPGMGRFAAMAYQRAFTDPPSMSSDVDVDSALQKMPVTLTTLEDWVREHADAFGAGEVARPHA